jgi:hypothetical protein
MLLASGMQEDKLMCKIWGFHSHVQIDDLMGYSEM